MTATPEVAPTPAPQPAADAAVNSTRYFALGLLLVVYISNYADRQILNVLAVQIMGDLHINKTEFGFLSGLAFALFYATLGIPIAVLADRVSRKWILVVSLSVWSVMTTACGLAANFWQLAISRVLVGVGEAGGSPPSHSMISDLFPASNRGTALAVYSLGVPVGIALGNIVGGLVGAGLGWRAAFFFLGIPGAALAGYIAYALREPPRGHTDGGIKEGEKVPSLNEVARFMWSQLSLRHTVIGATLITAVGYGSVTWTAAFLQYSHGMSLPAVATYLAWQTGVTAAIGTFLGGFLADRLAKRHIGWSAWVVTGGVVFSIPFSFIVYLSNDTSLVLWTMTATILVGGTYLAPTFALVQNLVGVRMRATAAAILLFVINLIGLGAGPLIVGAMADLLDSVFAKDAVRYSLFIFSALGLWGAWHYYIAPRTLKQDLERAAAA
ncbi:MAG: MFS transporter [Alphaproteobacteria bacterium]|nr:MFS transporter [Alphaproteobacteria bacterium]